jgi:HTH-like domain
MVAFIDDHRARYGVEPICRVLPIAPSTYFRLKAVQREPDRCCRRALGDEVLRAIIRAIWHENQQVYGPRKVWKQMGREGLRVARCRVRRLMREMGLVGASRGRADPSPRSWDPVSVDALYRSARRGRHCAVSRQLRRSYDNALAESIIGLFKTEVIQRKGP